MLKLEYHFYIIIYHFMNVNPFLSARGFPAKKIGLSCRTARSLEIQFSSVISCFGIYCSSPDSM